MKGVSIFLLLTCNLVGISFGGNKDAEFEHAMVNGASICIRLRVGLECVFNSTPNDSNLEDMDIAQRIYKQIELEKRLEKERREKEEKTVWGGIKKLFGSP